MNKILLCLILLLNTSTLLANQSKDVIITKLKVAEMTKRDQAIRLEIMSLMKQNSLDQLQKLGYLDKLKKIDMEDSCEVKKLLNRWGWPKKSLFGKQYCEDFWLLVQHADHDIELQKLALHHIHKIIQTDKAETKHYAYLWDRVKMNQHLPQRYGTQGRCINKHLWQPVEIEDEKNLNKRRYSVGLDSMEHYKKMMNEFCF